MSEPPLAQRVKTLPPSAEAEPESAAGAEAPARPMAGVSIRTGPHFDEKAASDRGGPLGAAAGAARKPSLAFSPPPAEEPQESAAPGPRSSTETETVRLAAPDQLPAESGVASREPDRSSRAHPPALAGSQESKRAPELPTSQLNGAAGTSQAAVPAATQSAAAATALTQPHPGFQPLSGPGADSVALLRGTDGAAAPASSPAGRSASAVAAQAGNSGQDPFVALDAAPGVGQPSWIHTGAQRAEAGFQDPALGWVGVRADLNGGGVHAALMPDSTAAAQVLSGHLAGLSAFLTEQHTPVATLTLADPATGGSGSPGDQSSQQGAGQNFGQPDARQTGAQVVGLNPPGQPARPVAEQGIDASAPWGEARGVHISVMA